MKKQISALVLVFVLMLTGCTGFSKDPERIEDTGQSEAFIKPEPIEDFEKTEQSESVQEAEESMIPSISSEVPEEEAGNQSGEEEVIELPILDEIDQNTRVATAGAYSTALRSAESLLDWGCYTGLDPEEIRAGAESWKNRHDEVSVAEFQEKLRTVDDAYLTLVGVINVVEDDTEDSSKDGVWVWGRERVEAIEIVMEVFGLRD